MSIFTLIPMGYLLKQHIEKIIENWLILLIWKGEIMINTFNNINVNIKMPLYEAFFVSSNFNNND